MTISRRTLLGTATAAATLPLVRPRAQGAPTIKIGVLNDMSGPYMNTGGPTSIVCAKQALEDFGVSGKGLNVEVINADHQNKPDLAVSIARQWFDRDGVDMLLDVPTSSVALAVQSVVREKNKVYLNSGAASSDLTGKACSPNFIHWTYDTYMLARSTGGAMVKAGGDSWYFLTADYAFGKQLQADTTALVQASGGKVAGYSHLSVPRHLGFLLVPGAGAVQPRQGARPVQRRRRYGELDQAGARVRHQPDDEGRGAADVRDRRARAWARRVAGAEPDRELLLGPE